MNTLDIPDDAAQTEQTRATIMRYHECWKARDLDGVMALYHPDVQYLDFFQQRFMGHAELRDYVRENLPRRRGEALEHTDRLRFDGNTAFIQCRIRLHSPDGLAAFRSCEALTVLDGLIWRVNEYATLIRDDSSEQPSADPRPALSRLGLSARQLGQMTQDLDEYMLRQQPYLDPQLNLQQVAATTGYTRNQVSHLLNQVLGQSFYRYINNKRLQHLLESLQQQPSASSVDALAFASGFNSLSAFYKCFREFTGQSPKAYLKEISLRVRTHDKP